MRTLLPTLAAPSNDRRLRAALVVALAAAAGLAAPAAQAADSVGACVGYGGGSADCFGASQYDCYAPSGYRAGVSYQRVEPGGTTTTCYAFVITGATPTWDTSFDGTCVQPDGSSASTICAGVLAVQTSYGLARCTATWQYDRWSSSSPQCLP